MNTVGVLVFGLVFVGVIWLFVAAYRRRHTASTLIAGATYDVMSPEQKGATEVVVDYRAGRKMEEQRSGEKEE